jgi:hypothetical protein
MACSNCGGKDHNIQRCPTVRRCGNCNRPSHDRRNCPKLQTSPDNTTPKASAPRAAPIPEAPAIWDQIEKLHDICTAEPDLLAHLYWPDRRQYFEQCSRAFLQGQPWRLKATPHHGVHKPERPTLNFMVADRGWVDAYATAAENRDIRHGVLIRGSVIPEFVSRSGYEVVKVRVGYPSRFGIVDPSEFWRCDLGNHRLAALDTMRFSTVIRLATPADEDARYVDVPTHALVHWW